MSCGLAYVFLTICLRSGGDERAFDINYGNGEDEAVGGIVQVIVEAPTSLSLLNKNTRNVLSTC